LNPKCCHRGTRPELFRVPTAYSRKQARTYLRPIATLAPSITLIERPTRDSLESRKSTRDSLVYRLAAFGRGRETNELGDSRLFGPDSGFVHRKNDDPQLQERLDFAIVLKR
jgi:hypothetical protein